MLGDDILGIVTSSVVNVLYCARAMVANIINIM